MTRSTESAAASDAGPSFLSALPAAQFDSPGQGQCVLDISGTTQIGPNAGQTFQGTLSISIGSDGAIDSGTLQVAGGPSEPVVGQATGRSIRLRIGSDPDSMVTFTGSGVSPLDECTGDLAGAFTGPGLENIGFWSATAQSGA
jgi:hypothetical protein